MCQGANSAVRFTTYATLKQLVQDTAHPSQPLPSAITFGIGAIAGLVTVYTTTPLDVIKTRMQQLDTQGRAQYRKLFHCAYCIFTQKGLTRVWMGTTSPLAWLVLSGGIVFLIHERIMNPISWQQLCAGWAWDIDSIIDPSILLGSFSFR
ncbi:mitochondrial carrier domain-containing protein [Coprinopsis sp. MPI-PUGE-AT-0042]|nr:mitochondrial carrier domain-containing protein [Coprinopsis sp. MPI-PUGE-AT-0042]